MEVIIQVTPEGVKKKKKKNTSCKCQKKKLRENNDQINLKKGGGRKQDYKQKSIKYHSQ